MNLSNFFPFWNQIDNLLKIKLENAISERHVPNGTILHNGFSDCLGLVLIKHGQLRAFISSDEGREITLYRLFEHDICLFTASCMMQSIQFDIFIEVEKDTELFIIPPNIYKSIMEQSAIVANYTNEIMASRFSEVMWLIEQIMWKSFDKRLAKFLYEESILEGTLQLKITHEKIANHLGTAREVVTRMLKYFQNEDLVSLSRGIIEIKDLKQLESRM